MKQLTIFTIAIALVIGCSISVALAEDAPKHAAWDKAEYKEMAPGISKATLWGNADEGAYGGFTKMAPAHDAGNHTHTNAVWIVVLKGAYLYKDDAGEKRVGPGEFLWIPAGHKHWSGADTKEGAVFYEESSGKFDLVPVK